MKKDGRIEVLALDLEATLISNAMSQIARPGLREFLDFCDGAFRRLVVYTSVPEDRFRRIARLLVDEGSAPEWFASIEYIEWDGRIKDLRRIPGANPEEIVIVDDHEPYIHPLQRRQWVAIRPFEAPYPEDDRELPRIRAILERMSSMAGSARRAGAAASSQRRQAAAIPYRVAGGGPEVLLVTSTSTGRWILPKGNVDAGNTPAQTAEIEAREEGGVVGSVWPSPVGEYHYEKASTRIRVVVFALQVDRVLETWAESGLRRRRWSALAEAMRIVEEPGVRVVLDRFAEAIGRRR